jgi:hypothetical protein
MVLYIMVVDRRNLLCYMIALFISEFCIICINNTVLNLYELGFDCNVTLMALTTHLSFSWCLFLSERIFRMLPNSFIALLLLQVLEYFSKCCVLALHAAVA